MSRRERRDGRERREKFNRLMIYVKIISLVQFIIFTISFYYSIKFLLSSEPHTRKESAEAISYIIIVLEALHIMFAFTYFPELNRVIREDEKINLPLIIESFLFANVAGLVLTLLAREKQNSRWKSNDNNKQES